MRINLNERRVWVLGDVSSALDYLGRCFIETGSRFSAASECPPVEKQRISARRVFSTEIYYTNRSFQTPDVRVDSQRLQEIAVDIQSQFDYNVGSLLPQQLETLYKLCSSSRDSIGRKRYVESVLIGVGSYASLDILQPHETHAVVERAKYENRKRQTIEAPKVVGLSLAPLSELCADTTVAYVASLTGSASKLKEAFDVLLKSSQATETELRARVEAQDAELAELRTERDELRARLEAPDPELKGLGIERDDLVAAIRALVGERENLVTERDSLRRQLERLSAPASPMPTSLDVFGSTEPD
jgi:hypothetical protein